jgi:XTP/dITP diphosphohydrolase
LKLLLSSGNAKKLRELRALLEPLGVDLLTPADVGGLDDVVEDLPTFAGNAAKKAIAAAQAKGHWALADDSGLEVEALDGAPGVLSARFAGVHGDDAANNRLLLERLAGLPEEERGARFVCALALSRPDGTLAAQFEGVARGRILEAPRGDGDFGYDPLFLFTEPGHDATGRGFAELSPEEKSAVSHRGRALRALASKLQALFAESA